MQYSSVTSSVGEGRDGTCLQKLSTQIMHCTVDNSVIRTFALSFDLSEMDFSFGLQTHLIVLLCFLDCIMLSSSGRSACGFHLIRIRRYKFQASSRKALYQRPTSDSPRSFFCCAAQKACTVRRDLLSARRSRQNLMKFWFGPGTAPSVANSRRLLAGAIDSSRLRKGSAFILGLQRRRDISAHN